MTAKKVLYINDGAELRSRAEKRLQENLGTAHPPVTWDEPLRLLHELQVHQVELEMQNEELRQARKEQAAALEKYTDLYDFAPVGYFTLDSTGTIRNANITGSSLLGIERSWLIGRRFALSVAIETRPAFVDFLGKVFTSQDKETCEVVLLKEGNYPFFIQIEGVAAASGEDCRIALIDITERKRAENEQSFLRHKLTKREREVLQMVGKGATSREIAERLGVSQKTIEAHRANLMKKLDVTNVAGLTRWAVIAERM